MRTKNKKIAQCAVFSALALVIYMLEAQIPILFPIPGMKLGLANVVTLSVMMILGKREALAVQTIRILLGNLFAGTFVSFCFSVVGGYLSYAIMAILIQNETIPCVPISMLSSIVHIAGELAVAAIYLGTAEVLYYAFALFLGAMVAGLFVGVCTAYLCKAYWKLFPSVQKTKDEKDKKNHRRNKNST